MRLLAVRFSLMIAIANACHVHAQALECEASLRQTSFEQAWRSLQEALVLRKPTEAQRLSRLRVDISDLADDKANLRDTLQLVVQNKSIPGWLTAKVKTIPETQQKIKSLLITVSGEVCQGGVLAADSKAYLDMKELLRAKNPTLCQLGELASRPFPLSSQELSTFQSLINGINSEIAAMRSLDPTLADLIQRAQEKQPPQK